MNPSQTTRLRPRERATPHSPRPSPVSSPGVTRRSGSLPVSTLETRASSSFTTVTQNPARQKETTLRETPQLEKPKNVVQSELQKVRLSCKNIFGSDGI